MAAVPRRLVKSRPSQVLSSRAKCSGPTTATGYSGSCGGFILSMGLISKSPSATAHLKKACSPR
jgi:hypothetical protein